MRRPADLRPPLRGTAAVLVVAASVLAALAAAAPAAAEGDSAWTEDAAELRSPDPATIRTTGVPGESNKFGQTLAVAGDRLVVGHAERQSGGQALGAGLDHPERAFVFRRADDGSGWVLEAPLVPPAGQTTETTLEFGRAVAMSPDATTVVVGAPHAPGPAAESQAGRAYVFVRDGTDWTLQATLSSPNAAANDRFGASVAVDGDTVVVGAEGDRADPAAPSDLNGAAYVHTRTGTIWALSATLRSPVDPLPTGASFGQRVAVSGDTIAVGDVGPGAVHVFTGGGSTWTLQHTATGVFATSGHGLVVDGDVLVVGSEWLGDFPTKGGASVLTRSGTTWSAPTDLVGVLEAAGATKPAWFGGAVDVDGTLIAVGTGRGTGTVMTFEVTDDGVTFGEELTKPPANAFNTRQFGRAVGVAGPHLVAAAPWECNSSCGTTALDGFNVGAVFTFTDPTRATATEEDAPAEGGGAVQPEPVAVTWVPTPPGDAPRKVPATAEGQREGGAPSALTATSAGGGTVTYADAEGLVSATFRGDPTTDVARGLVATAAGAVTCQVCADLVAGTVVEVWAFSEPRLVAAAAVDGSGCLEFEVPLYGPLDGGAPIAAGQHTLQVILPMADGAGRLAVNVGLTVGPPVPTGVAAGEGPYLTVGAPVPARVGPAMAALVLLLGWRALRRRALA